jgi:hypothetical protein
MNQSLITFRTFSAPGIAGRGEGSGMGGGRGERERSAGLLGHNIGDTMGR